MPSPVKSNDACCALLRASRAPIEPSARAAGKGERPSRMVSGRVPGGPLACHRDRLSLPHWRAWLRASVRLLHGLYAAACLKLYGIVARILGRRGTDLADAAFEDVFVRVWQRAGDFEPSRGSPRAWLATMARDLALDEALDEVRRKAAGSRAHVPKVFARPSQNDASANSKRNEEQRRRKQCRNGLVPVPAPPGRA